MEKFSFQQATIAQQRLSFGVWNLLYDMVLAQLSEREAYSFRMEMERHEDPSQESYTKEGKAFIERHVKALMPEVEETSFDVIHKQHDTPVTNGPHEALDLFFQTPQSTLVSPKNKLVSLIQASSNSLSFVEDDEVKMLAIEFKAKADKAQFLRALDQEIAWVAECKKFFYESIAPLVLALRQDIPTLKSKALAPNSAKEDLIAYAASIDRNTGAFIKSLFANGDSPAVRIFARRELAQK